MAALFGPSQAPELRTLPMIPQRGSEEVRKAGDNAVRVQAGRASNYLADPTVDYSPHEKASKTLGSGY